MRFRRRLVLTLLAAVVLLASSCGKKGDIRPPLVLRPQPAEELRAVQRGGRIRLEWTDPTTATDGSPLAGIAEIEIWLEVRPDPPPPPAAKAKDDFAARAKRIGAVVPAAGTEPSTWEYPFDPAGWKSRLFVFAVRAREARKGRLSEFSNEAAVKIQAVPLPPSGLRVRVFEDRIEVAWTPPEKNIDDSVPAAAPGATVLRAEGDGPFRRLTALPVKGAVYVDKDFVFGRVYRYVVRAATTLAVGFLESDDSAAVEAKPLDTFPPAAPAGLSIAAGPDFLTLVWDANAETDLAGYHVWRRTGEAGEFIRLTKEPILESTYIDKAVVKDTLYAYAVQAVDAAGNAGPRSAVVTEILKDKDPRP
jgi:hypothetical protein